MNRVFYLKPGDQIDIASGVYVIEGKGQNGFWVTEYEDEYDEDGNMIGQNTIRKSYFLDKKDLQRHVYDYTGHVYSFFWYTEDPDYNERAEEGVPF